MTDVNEWIKERRRIHDAATDVLLRNGYELERETDLGAQDTAAIVDAHNTLPNLLTAVEKVLELHKRDETLGICFECDYYYPCPTVRAVQSAIEGANNE